MTDLLTFGECLITLRANAPFAIGSTPRLSIAGAESNVAIGLARLGHSVTWCGVVAEDSLGDLIVRTLRGEGVDTTTVRHVANVTNATMLVEQQFPHASTVTYLRRGSAGSKLCPDDVDAALVQRPRILHLSAITPALGPTAAAATQHAAERGRAAGATISLSLNFRRRLWTETAAIKVLRRLTPLADVVFASEDELWLASGHRGDPATTVTRLLEQGVGEVVITRGSDGAEVSTADETVSAPALFVNAVDPIGAGDAFSAGYLSAKLDGADLSGRLHRGIVLGAAAVSTYSDWEGLPRRNQLTLVEAKAGAVRR